MVSDPSVRIRITGGDYFLLDEADSRGVGHVIFHEPEIRGKGLTLVPTLDQRVMAGPTDREVTAEAVGGTKDAAYAAEVRATDQRGIADLRNRDDVEQKTTEDAGRLLSSAFREQTRKSPADAIVLAQEVRDAESMTNYANAAGMGLKMVVSTEYLVQTRDSLGKAVYSSSYFNEYQDIYAYALIMIFLVLALTQLPVAVVRLWEWGRRKAVGSRD